MSDADLYRRASQYRLWSFSKSELARRAEYAHASANRLESSGQRLSIDEERKLVLYFAALQTKSLCEALHLPSQVRATAVLYFRRFYLSHSVMEYEPKLVLTTCVYLGAKADNAYLSIRKFCDALKKVEPQQVLDLEFPLLRTLKFTLQVHSALRPLHGFFLDMQARLAQSYTVEQLVQIHDKARQVVLDSLVSDVYFLFTPPQIALAALMESNELAATEYAACILPESGLDLTATLALVTNCRQMMMEELPSREECLQISKKLRLFHKGLPSASEEDVQHDPSTAPPEKKKIKTETI